jgi:hypothetical protein
MNKIPKDNDGNFCFSVNFEGIGMNIRNFEFLIRFGTVRYGRSENSLKPVFHFNRIVSKRSVFLCFLSGNVELMTSIDTNENATARYD